MNKTGNRKGIKHSEETKKKMSEAHKGKKYALGSKHSDESKMKRSISMKGNKFALDMKHSDKTKKQMSESHKGLEFSDDHRIKISMGQQHVIGIKDWKGFITPENDRIRKSPEYAAWRTEVFKRDNYTCQDCGEKGGNLQAHHIMSFSEYPKYRLIVEFGHTLCKKCHKELHERLREYKKIQGF